MVSVSETRHRRVPHSPSALSWRLKPLCPVAQKLQRIAHPACEDQPNHRAGRAAVSMQRIDIHGPAKSGKRHWDTHKHGVQYSTEGKAFGYSSML